MDKDKEELLVIEPIIGYREWNVRLYKIKGKWEFRLIGNGAGEKAGYWKNGIAEAKCLKEAKHKVPDFNCECGFYANKYKIDFIKNLLNINNNITQFTFTFSNGFASTTEESIPQDISVYGIVELLGKVIEHSDGYRAEKVKIKEIFFTHNCSKLKFSFKVKKAKNETEQKKDDKEVSIYRYPVYLSGGTYSFYDNEDKDYETIVKEFKTDKVIKSLKDYYKVPIIYYKDYLEKELLK
ncbi:MAG: hypothetical protein PVJ67_04415 [Candidatus Pacearchaeota archaeon]|jgi:hypothetical protein